MSNGSILNGTSHPLHALVFGASGVSGWAILKELLSYPTPSTFTRITGLTNRPLSVESACLPSDPRLLLTHGVDLLSSEADVKAALKKAIPDVETVTHIFYTAFKGSERGIMDDVREWNTHMARVAISAVSSLSPKLEIAVMQTGTNVYGVTSTSALGDKFPKTPIKEDAPRLPEPYYSQTYYYYQVDAIEALRKESSMKWTWTEPRPDVVVGFVPNGNVHNTAQNFGLYLAFYAFVYGAGKECPFPGSSESYKTKASFISQDNLAKQNIFLSLRPDESSQKAFNVGDGADASWPDLWPKLCSYFGLKGTPPFSSSSPEGEKVHGEEWVEKNREKVAEFEERYGLEGGLVDGIAWWYFDFVVGATPTRELDLSRLRSLGWKQSDEVYKGFYEAFDRMAEKGMVPKLKKK